MTLFVAKFARWPTALGAGLIVIAATAGLYARSSNWTWQATGQAAAGSTSPIERKIERLERHLHEIPDDLDGWLLLGRSYTDLNRYYRAADAFQHALKLADGSNIEALLGLGTALSRADQASLRGYAAALFEQALKLAPQDSKALWWGGIAAYHRGDLALARARWKQVLSAANLRSDIVEMITLKISEIDRQIGPASNQGHVPAELGGLRQPTE